MRDELLHRDRPGGREFDLATSARPEETVALVESWADVVWQVGQAFGTVACRKDGVTIEITTFRADTYREESRKPEVAFSDTIEADLVRRDLTINAIALRLPDLQLVDPTGGVHDVAQRTLRTPQDPHRTFSDDPLRLVRVARFLAELPGFAVEEHTRAAMEEMAPRLDIVSRERVRDEFNRLLVAPNVEEALWLLVETGIAAQFVPELPALRLEQDPVHQHKDVLAHTVAVTGKAPPGNLRLRLACLLHDIGKPATRRIEGGRVTFHGHDVVGARMARRWLRTMRYDRDLSEEVARLVFMHLRMHTYDLGWNDSALRRYVRDAGPLLADLNALVRCDCTTRNMAKRAALMAKVDELEARIADLSAREELASIRPPIDGHEVMAYLGIGPGPLVGEALDLLLERRLDEGPYPPEEAFALLDRFAKEKGLVSPSA